MTGPLIRLRVVGTPVDCAATVARLREVLAVVDVSRFYPCRDTPGLVRVYITATAAGTWKESTP